MTGEEIMQNSCDMQTYSSMLGDLGEKWHEHEIDEETHDKAIKLLQHIRYCLELGILHHVLLQCLFDTLRHHRHM